MVGLWVVRRNLGDEAHGMVCLEEDAVGRSYASKDISKERSFKFE